MVIHNNSNFLDKIRSNIYIYIYIYIYRARGLKHFISALGILILVAVFCGIIGIGNYKASAESSGSLTLTANMTGVTLDLTIPQNAVLLQLDPTSTLTTADASAIVTTDAPYGYTLMMTASSSNLTRTTMLDGEYPIIPTLTAGTNDFPPNRWGYKLPTDSKFKSFDPTGVQVGYSDSAETTGKTETITFGAKANSNTPIGSYELELTLSALVNPKTLLTINDIATMQQFKNMAIDDKYSVLDSMTEGTSYTVKDSRDNQEYTVAKLFDGNIWMTKNLDLAGGTTLTPETSNVASNYTLPASSASGFISGTNIAYVYNSGRATCASNSPCYSYYSYRVATAGVVPSSSGENVPSDICPAGWRLPTKAEYETLIGTYDTAAKLVASPFLGTYSGYYAENAFRSTSGNYWSSTNATNTGAFSMNFETNNYASVDEWWKEYGGALRCIAQ